VDQDVAEMEENMKAKQDKLLADWAKIDADREKRRADLKAFNKMMERREAERKDYEKKRWAEREADQKKRKADFEKRMGERKSDQERREAGRKGRTIGKRSWKGIACKNGIRDLGLKQQLRGGRRPLYLRMPMEQTWGNSRSLKQLVAAGMRMTHHAKVAWHKEHGLRKQVKDDIALRILKGLTSRKKCWKGPKCKIGMKNPYTVPSA
jgi:hypothetical protein